MVYIYALVNFWLSHFPFLKVDRKKKKQLDFRQLSILTIIDTQKNDNYLSMANLTKQKQKQEKKINQTEAAKLLYFLIQTIILHFVCV